MGTPWYFRYRAFAIGGIYFAGFLIGEIVDALAGHGRPRSTFDLVAHHGPAAEHAAIALALVLVYDGWALRWWGTSYLRGSVVFDASVRTDTLHVAGPFRYVRNPLYLGNLMQAVAIGALDTWEGLALIAGGQLALALALIRAEERALAATYGEAFERYRRDVPALIPRLRASGEPSAARPAYREGFVRELLTLGFAVAATLVLMARMFSSAVAPSSE